MSRKGYTDKTKDHREIMNCLTGSGITEGSNKKHIKQQARAMLTTHLRVLFSMDELVDDRDTSWTDVEAGGALRVLLPEHRQHNKISIAAEDLKDGKISVGGFKISYFLI